ncbi:MAG TPA: enoyl-CoA hydratase/isomerase family protein [Solirubrobacter sp.]|nr:enoyl-CoA hydratase/isomerase family protein [Solirubrobacter sp.]
MNVTRIDRDGVVQLVLDRAEARNAFTTELLEELREHLATVDEPLLLTGAGEAFCAGADLNETATDERFELMGDVLRELRALEPPTLAAVHGPAIGGGWGLALACDLCFASRAASFCLPEVAKGFRLPAPLMERLIEVVGPVRANELAFAGTRWDPANALAAGCVTRVYDDREALLAGALDLCADLAKRPARSLATVKGVT